MLLRLLFPAIRPLSLICFNSRHRSKCASRDMGLENLHSKVKRPANFRLCNVSSYTTELLEIHADDPTMRVLFIPGNPGVVSFYKDFVESLYELLGGSASVTAIGHISHTRKNWECGRLFSLQEQIDHKMDFIRQELQNIDVPMLLVGHSIGAYISMEMLRSCPEKVMTALYNFDMFCVHHATSYVIVIQSNLLSNIFAGFIGGIFCWTISIFRIKQAIKGTVYYRKDFSASRFIVKNSLGKSWSATAVEATCTHLLQYHTMRNILFMAMTEFRKLAETPDWMFMRGHKDKIAFLFGVDDHWGPLQMFEEISKQVPNIALSIEREGHTHGFCCTEEGSSWVAQHAATLIKNRLSNSGQ